MGDRAVVATRCPWCSVMLVHDAAVYTETQSEQRFADHRKVCKRRPVEVGDYVRYDCEGRGLKTWAEGEVLGPAKDAAWAARGWLSVRVVSVCLELANKIGGEHDFGPATVRNPNGIRRILRPGAGERTCCPGGAQGFACGCSTPRSGAGLPVPVPTMREIVESST
jgi:hypothetical protein